MKKLLTSTIFTAIVFFSFLLSCSSIEADDRVPTRIEVVEFEEFQPWEIPYHEVHIYDQYGNLMEPTPNISYELQIYDCGGDFISYRNWSSGAPFTRIVRYESCIVKLIWGFHSRRSTRNIYTFNPAGQLITSYKCDSHHDD